MNGRKAGRKDLRAILIIMVLACLAALALSVTESSRAQRGREIDRASRSQERSTTLAPSATTVLHFQGNTEDPAQGNALGSNCTGDGRSDLLACDGPFLSENATLSSSPTAKWVIDSARGGANNRTIYDTSWVWRPSVATTVGGNMTIDFWADVNAAAVVQGMVWRVKLSNQVGGPTTATDPPTLSAGEFYQAFHTATPSTPGVPQKLTIQLTNVPVTDVTNGMVLVIEPKSSDTGADSHIWYDSTAACPGAASGPCDSTITVDATTAATPTPTPTPTPAGSSLEFSIDATASNGTVRTNSNPYIDIITIKNPTSTTATNVTVQAVLAPGAVYVGGPTTPAPAGGVGTNVDPLVWSLPDLAAGGVTHIYLYQRAMTEAEDHTIVWQLLDTKSTLSYQLSGGGLESIDTTMGPKVVPLGEVGDTVRHGKRPFPVAFVDYADQQHTEPDSKFLGFFDSLRNRYMEMSFGQLLPQPTMPSLGKASVTFASTPGAKYRFSSIDPTHAPAGFCGGASAATDGDSYDDDDPPLAMTDRVVNGWYQLPGTRGYYGSDSSGSAYPAFLVPGAGALANIDNGCGPPGKIAYDAATLMDPDVDFNDFDSDRDGWVDFFELVYQGQPENILGQTGADNVWPHSSGLQYYYTDGYKSHDRLRDHQDRPLFWVDAAHKDTTLTDTGIPAYVRVGSYNVNAEFSDAITFAHEYGHSLGSPDEYTPAGRNTIDDWSLMASGPGHMGIWDKQEFGWIIPTPLTANRNVAAQQEVKKDTHKIEWKDSNGVPYTLTGNVHNADVYKVNLPKAQLFDPTLIPSGNWVYYSGQANGLGYPGHVLAMSFDGSMTANATSLKLQFKSWFEIENDYDYGYLQVCQYSGPTLNCTNLPSVNDSAEGGPTTANVDTVNSGNNHGNGITCVSGKSNDATCGVNSYPAPAFITDEFDLSAYKGQDFIVQWAYSTDPGTVLRSWVIDDIELLDQNNTRLFFDDAEDATVSRDANHTYDGWVRSNGTATQEHAYWIGVRDKTGFDSSVGWTPGVVMEYANEAHGFGNSGVDDPPAYTVLDSHPTVGSSAADLTDAAWKPFPSSPGVLTADNGDIFTDCDNATYSAGPRHIDNYVNPNSSDQQWHFGYQKLRMLVNSTSGAGTFGTMTANVSYTLAFPCGAPTAAAAILTGRVLDADGRGIRSATITMTAADGRATTVRTSSMGYYRFDNLSVGQSYVVSANASGYKFNSRFVRMDDSEMSVDFTPQ